MLRVYTNFYNKHKYQMKVAKRILVWFQIGVDVCGDGQYDTDCKINGPKDTDGSVENLSSTDITKIFTDKNWFGSPDRSWSPQDDGTGSLVMKFTTTNANDAA